MRATSRVGATVALVAALVLPTAGAAQQPPGGDDSPRRVDVLGGEEAVPSTVAAPLAGCVDRVDRLAGADRYATAAAVARRTRPAADVVFLASGEQYADALASGPVVAAADAVLLLTRRDTLPEATREELRRRAPSRVVVLGRDGAVADDVVAEVRALGPRVRRVGGADRFGTAARLAGELPDPDTVVVASGRGFADALAVAPVAAGRGAPVLLVEPDRVPAPVADVLDGLHPREVVVVGGRAAVSDAVLAEVAERTGAPAGRIGGVDRYATADAIAARLWPTPTGHVAVTTGTSFADALAAAPVLEAPLLLVGRDLAVGTASQLQRLADGDCRQVEVRPDPVEGLTLGPSSTGGTVLAVEVADGRVVLDGPDDTGALLLDADGGDRTARLAYPTPAAGSAVTWTQPLVAGADALVARQPWRGARPAPPDDLTVAWQYTGDSARYRTEVAAAPGVDVTAPFRYHLDSGGSLVGGADPAFVRDMHARGVDVWPTVHTCGATCIDLALSDPARRSSYAQRIARDAIASGADGVNIDIEGFRDAERDAVTSFVEELSALVRPAGLVTSFDLTVMTDTWHTPPEGYAFWSTAPDRRAISEAVDYVVLMAYDQFNRYRPAGPVASPGWVEEALRYQLRFTDPDRLLLGVPLYGRVWRGGDPVAVGMGQLESLVAGGRRTADPRFGVDRVDLPDGRVTWAETTEGLRHRVDLVDAFGLAGTAAWRLGFDTPGVWPVLADG